MLLGVQQLTLESISVFVVWLLVGLLLLYTVLVSVTTFIAV